MSEYTVQLKDPESGDSWFPIVLGKDIISGNTDFILGNLNNAASIAIGETLGYVTLKLPNNNVLQKARVPFSALIDDDSTGNNKVTSIIDGNF